MFTLVRAERASGRRVTPAGIAWTSLYCFRRRFSQRRFLLRSKVIVEADELDVRLQIKTVGKDLPRKSDYTV